MTRSPYLLAAALLWLVALLLGFAVEAGAMREFDTAVLLALAGPARAAGWPVPVMLMATVVGSAIVRLPIAGAAAVALAVRRDWRGAAAVMAATLGVLLVNAGLKHVVGRARPELLPHLAAETSLSFPSGHSSNAAAVFLVLGWVLVRQGASPRLVWPVAVLLVAAVGVSRVVLGVHWPTDVIAGWCVGTGWMLICAGIAGTPRAFRAGQQRNAAMADDERDRIYAEFNAAVNMTPAEIERFLKRTTASASGGKVRTGRGTRSRSGTNPASGSSRSSTRRRRT